MTLVPEDNQDINSQISSMQGTLSDLQSTVSGLQDNFNTFQDSYTYHSHNGYDGSQSFSGNTTMEDIILTGGVIQYNKRSFTDSVNYGYYISKSGVYIGSANDDSYLRFSTSTGELLISGSITSGGTITGSIIDGTTINGGTINGTSINGGTITGTIFETASSGNARMVIGETQGGSVPGGALVWESAGNSLLSFMFGDSSGNLYLDGNNTIVLAIGTSTATVRVILSSTGTDTVIFNLPTSATGLPAGSLWRNGTVVNIV